jgi:Arc/MetJ-type ribon-helix-helix transcriptional regulator
VANLGSERPVKIQMVQLIVTFEEENAEYARDKAGNGDEFSDKSEVVNEAVSRMRQSDEDYAADDGNPVESVSSTIEELHKGIRRNDERITDLEDRLNESE